MDGFAEPWISGFNFEQAVANEWMAERVSSSSYTPPAQEEKAGVYSVNVRNERESLSRSALWPRGPNIFCMSPMYRTIFGKAANSPRCFLRTPSDLVKRPGSNRP